MSEQWKVRWLVSFSYRMVVPNPDSKAYEKAKAKGHTPTTMFGEVQAFNSEAEAMQAIRWARENPEKWAPPGAIEPMVSSALRQIIKPGHQA